MGGCGRAMPSSRGMGKPGFSRPSPGGRVWAGAARGQVWEGYALKQGCGATGFPHTLTWSEGGGGRRLRTGVWGNRVSPPSHPVGGCGRAQPVGRGLGKPGFPRPSPGGRVWESNALEQGHGEIWFPHPLTWWEGVGGHSPWAGVWGNRVSPDPHPVGGCGRAMPSSRGVGKPGFPLFSPGGRVWAGAARGQGSGETWFPHTLTR